MKIGILRETKDPPDKRVSFTPSQIVDLKKVYSELEVVVQPSDIRCYSDKEYKKEGIALQEDLKDCDVLFGVKEVEVESLIPEKTYFIFSHVGKKQTYNRPLLQECVWRWINLIDYEYLTDKEMNRLVAFGYWAGVVGAYNGLRAWGERYRSFQLKPAHACKDLSCIKEGLKAVEMREAKVLVTGGGRVAGGAMEILREAGLREVTPEDYLSKEFDEAVVCRIDPWHYVEHKDGEEFELEHFFSWPSAYVSTFKPYTRETDFYVACHYWDPTSPVFMTATDMREPEFRIKVIADVSCDIGGPIPSTLRASSIESPLYGYDPMTEKETPPFELRSVTVMAVDNLPGELPRDASEDFGKLLSERVIPSLLLGDKEGIIDRATIVYDGALTEHFKYLKDFLEGRE